MIQVVHQILCDNAVSTAKAIAADKHLGYGECMVYERVFRMPHPAHHTDAIERNAFFTTIGIPIKVSLQDAINSGWHIEPPTVDGKVTCPLCQEAGNQTTTKE